MPSGMVRMSDRPGKDLSGISQAPAVPCASSLEAKFKTKDLAFGQLTEQFIPTMRISSLTKGMPWTPYGITWQFSRESVQRAYPGRTLRAVHVPALRLRKQTVKTLRACCAVKASKIRGVRAPHDAPPGTAKGPVLFACYTLVAYSDAVTVTGKPGTQRTASYG